MNNQQTDPAFDRMRADTKAAFEQLDKMREPMKEIIDLNTELNVALTQDKTATDTDFRSFLHEDLAPGMAKRLHKERSNDDNYLRVVGQFLETLVKYFGHEVMNNRFSHPMAAAMTQLFNHEAGIHKNHYAIPDIELAKLRTANQSWRKDLTIGDWVDVYVNADERGKLKGWMQAQITAVIDDDDLFLEFPLSSLTYDGRMSRWSPDLV
jgi:hypothetical protein